MIKKQILQSLHTILHQHYFQINDGFYEPLTGVAMELILEIFLQCYENLNIKRIIKAKHIVFYTR